MKLPDKPASTPTPQSTKKTTTSVAVWVTVILVVLGGIITTAIVRSQIESIKNNGKNTSLLTSSDWETYNSTQDDFSVKFPGFPVVENSSLDVQGYSIPYNTYEKDNGDDFWIVAVSKYPPSFDMSDTKARLEGALNGAIQNTPGAVYVSSSYIKLDGHTALKGKYKVVISGETYDMYYLATLRGNTLYGLLGSSSESDFDIFINSFQST